MTERELTIVNRLGLHARAAAQFVRVAGHYGCEVRIRHGEREADGKSIMGVMMLAASVGSRVTVSTDGEDEDEALEALARLVADRFGEDD
jgi:phosphocarrier protein